MQAAFFQYLILLKICWQIIHFEFEHFLNTSWNNLSFVIQTNLWALQGVPRYFFYKITRILIYWVINAKAICHLFQLSLAESDISKIGAIKVEGIINPTNAEIDLKDGIGKQTTT